MYDKFDSVSAVLCMSCIGFALQNGSVIKSGSYSLHHSAVDSLVQLCQLISSIAGRRPCMFCHLHWSSYCRYFTYTLWSSQLSCSCIKSLEFLPLDIEDHSLANEQFRDKLITVSVYCILLIQTLALYKSFTCLLTYLHDCDFVAVQTARSSESKILVWTVLTTTTTTGLEGRVNLHRDVLFLGLHHEPRHHPNLVTWFLGLLLPL